MECGRDTGEECSPVGSPEHAGEYAQSIGLEFFKDVAAFGHPDQPAVFCIGHPNGSFRIETDSVWRNVHLTKKLSNLFDVGGSPKAAHVRSPAQHAGGDVQKH